MVSEPIIIEFYDLAAGHFLLSLNALPLPMFLPRTSNLKPGPVMVRAFFMSLRENGTYIFN